jgi:transposase-like protein
MRKIRNGVAYPLSLKNAALDAWKNTSKSGSKIAKEFNISTNTMHKWVSEAGLQRGTNQGATAALQARISAVATRRAFNTPAVQLDGTIMYQGRVYK